ncbi:unnamed protein product [Fraxinus pennsylvanica]|uniref:Uncharacterized protein n=1 Tax=Fraxinus pennsylvanica TaxID=56036 RepID=A0AAD2DMW3_9LAMI|nr:unnamed protein product [Fraxinus pennsylvanica]
MEFTLPIATTKCVKFNMRRCFAPIVSPASPPPPKMMGTDPISNRPPESSLVPILGSHTLSKDAAMGLVLSAANERGWITGSGMEGPSVPAISVNGADIYLPRGLCSASLQGGVCAWHSRATPVVNAPLVQLIPMPTPMALSSYSAVGAIYFISCSF